MEKPKVQTHDKRMEYWWAFSAYSRSVVFFYNPNNPTTLEDCILAAERQVEQAFCWPVWEWEILEEDWEWMRLDNEPGYAESLYPWRY